MKRVLFLCVHNSARSQMAEEYLRKYGGPGFEAESAGLEPGVLNPYVVRVLAEEGIDIGGKATRDVMTLFVQGRTYDCVVTVCSKEAAERCPIFPGKTERYHWPFEDPSTFAGTDDQVMARVRQVAGAIREKVLEFIHDQAGNT